MKLLLLQQKTDVNQVTSQSTALHLAVLNENMDCLEVLLQNDIDIDTIDETGKRAIDVCSNSNMRKLLMRKA
jgi:ankyrin repeat protein